LSVTELADEVGANLAGLESVWDGSMSEAYAFFRHQVRPVPRGESPLEAGAPGNPGRQHPPVPRGDSPLEAGAPGNPGHRHPPVPRGDSPLEADAPGNPGRQHPPEVALAAALVESAVALQDLGRAAPEPAQLLLGDLCLARASRLLAETGDTRLQVAFAVAVERVAAEAAGGPASRALRDLLVAAISGQR